MESSNQAYTESARRMPFIGLLVRVPEKRSRIQMKCIARFALDNGSDIESATREWCRTGLAQAFSMYYDENQGSQDIYEKCIRFVR